MSYFKVNEKCNGCLACVQNCPASALDFNDEKDIRTLSHNIMKCARCGQCWRVCPQDAIEFQYLVKGGWDEVVSLELIRCKVCNEPVHSVQFGSDLSNKIKAEIEPLCPRHRQRSAYSYWTKHLYEDDENMEHSIQ